MEFAFTMAYRLVMSTNDFKPETAPDIPETIANERVLPPAALRALAEAEERRKAAKAATLPREIGGRGGPEPSRFGDWEIDGRAIDF